jgi:basic amino acid/polyamine antiporter, APA family
MSKQRSKLDRVVQLLIPPSLVLLLLATIIELFFGVSSLGMFVDIFDAYIIIIFAIDLYYRWQENPHFIPWVKKYFLDIIATIPFNLIFLGVEGLVFLQALRGIRIATRALRSTKYIRLFRLARLPRFMRMRKQIKPTVIKKVQPHEKELKKTLSFKVILLITINSIMGTGIWFLTSAGAKHAGPASLLSWLILSGISIYISMCFGELVSMFPKAGGVYEFAKQTYGRFASFVIGWTTAIAGSVTIAMLLLGALQYLIPLKYSYYYIPIAIAFVIIFSLIAYKGMQTSTYVLVTFALITLGAVIGIIIPGLFNLNVSNFDPFFVFPTASILLAIFFIAETFFGWESAIFLAAETKNAKKVMPRALVVGTIVIAVLAFLLAFTAIGTIPWEQFSTSSAPLQDLGEAHFGGIGKFIFTILIFVSVIGATAGWIVTSPRLLMALAEDKLFFTQFAKIHPKRKSPYVSIIFQALVVSILVFVGAGSYETLLHMLIPLIIVVYSSVLLAVVVLRFKRPSAERPFKVWFGKVGPFITIGFMFFLLYMFIQETHDPFDILRISGALIAFGIPAYFTIELFYDQKYVNLRRNLLAHIRHKSPKSTKLLRRILNRLPRPHKKHIIVDMNSPVGSMSKHVLENHHIKKIHVINTSKEELSLIKTHPKREKHYLKKVGVPSAVKKVDLFISHNDLGLAEDVEKFVGQIAKSLRKGGRFVFYVSQHGLNMAPNIHLLEDKKKLMKLFKKFGLKMKYEHKKGWLKEEFYISGKK